jgi:hypothetical protein
MLRTNNARLLLQELTPDTDDFHERQVLTDGLPTLEILKQKRTKSCKG